MKKFLASLKISGPEVEAAAISQCVHIYNQEKKEKKKKKNGNMYLFVIGNYCTYILYRGNNNVEIRKPVSKKKGEKGEKK